MNWWQTILLFIGACGGLPMFVLIGMGLIDQHAERRLDATREARVEHLVEKYGETTSSPRPAAGISGLRESMDAAARAEQPDPPHQGFRT